MDRMRAVFDADWFGTRPPPPRPIRRPYHRRNAALGHHAGRAVPGRASGSARCRRTERHPPARLRGRCARRRGSRSVAHRGVDKGRQSSQRGAVLSGMRPRASRRAGRGPRRTVSRPSSHPRPRSGAGHRQASGQLPAPRIYRHHPSGGEDHPLPARSARQRDLALLHRLHGRHEYSTTCAPSDA